MKVGEVYALASPSWRQNHGFKVGERKWGTWRGVPADVAVWGSVNSGVFGGISRKFLKFVLKQVHFFNSLDVNGPKSWETDTLLKFAGARLTEVEDWSPPVHPDGCVSVTKCSYMQMQGASRPTKVTNCPNLPV